MAPELQDKTDLTEFYASNELELSEAESVNSNRTCDESTNEAAIGDGYGLIRSAIDCCQSEVRFLSALLMIEYSI